MLIRPWFESRVFVYDQAYVLPHQNAWQPILPGTELKVEDGDADFRNSLADPEYNRPKEVHIILGVGFIARVFKLKIGYNIDGTALFSTHFGNVLMGEHKDGVMSDVCNENSTVEAMNSIVDDTVNEKLNAMLEKLWRIDDADCSESNQMFATSAARDK